MSKILCFFFTFTCFLVKGQVQLSEKSNVSIITIGPYQEEVWSAFGHSGIRVQDSVHGIDLFFNYGLFDFEQKNFFLNFIQGLLIYKVGVSPYEPIKAFYIQQNRYIREQVLSLTQQERQDIFLFLMQNVKPENAEYLYNYVFDNCATQIRDLFEKVFSEQITFDTSYYIKDLTFRQLIHQYLNYQPWGALGIDIGLGLQIDRSVDLREYMFLPEYIYKAFQYATIDRNSKRESFVFRTEEVFAPKQSNHTLSLISPLNLFILLFFVIGLITHRNIKFSKRTKWLDFILFFMTGILGCWILYLWLGTQHLSQWNLNILWAIPLHLPVLFLINSAKYRPFIRYYFLSVAIFYCILLLVWALLPQPLNIAIVPLVLAMTLRCFYIYYDFKKMT